MQLWDIERYLRLMFLQMINNLFVKLFLLLKFDHIILGHTYKIIKGKIMYFLCFVPTAAAVQNTSIITRGIASP